eukprot:SAG22_NODE_3343_length_1768_cov_0.899940_1_plen_589_part_11
MGQPDEQLGAIVGTIKGMSVNKAKELIQDKIRGRLPSGPSELRRTFQFFDRDGSGAISLEEFRQALQLQCGLQFEPALLRKIMASFGAGDDGASELDYKMFSEMVMGSSTRDATSIGHHKKASRSTNNDEGNSDAAIRRKVQEEQKPLMRAFKHASDEAGYMTPHAFKDVLFHMDIVMEEDGFAELVAAMMKKSKVPNKISGSAFLRLYGKGSKADRGVLATIKNVSVEQAKQMIQDKIRGRLPSGPSELRRTFQFFDRDGGGTVSVDEFKYACKRYLGLQFEEKILAKLIKEFDEDGTGELDFAKFSRLVLGSTRESDGTSMTDNSALLSVSDDNGNSDMMLRRKVREKMRPLMVMFKQTADAAGNMTPAQLKDVLYKHDILIAQKQFNELVKVMDEDGDGEISYQEFIKYFDKGQADEVALTPTITSMPLAQVTELIQEKVAAKMPGGPAALRRAWALFNGDGTGAIDSAELAQVLKVSLGLIFGEQLLAEMVGHYSEGTGTIDFNKFAQNVMKSSGGDATSISNSAGKRVALGDDNGNSEQMLRRNVRERWKDLHIAFKHQATKQGDGSRALSPDKLRVLLETFDI